MKKSILILLPVFAVFLFIAAQQPVHQPQPVAEDIELGWPEDVMGILERSCFDCHTDELGSLKPKSKLNFSKWEEYKLSKKIGKLDDIIKEVDEKKMPPKKYLDDYPDRALSDEEIKLIKEWANAEADKLMQE
ncbi:MAG: heme-binding domain-containing protein [Bacteroidales bacterium]|jgi:hypothetical protein|nr:heme-binding domain-containing protein [Bacteroidales bacterium]